MLYNEHPTTFIYVDNHTSGQFSNSETSGRATFYGVSGVPDVRIDGNYDNSLIGGGDGCNSRYNVFRSFYNSRMTQTGGNSPVSITGSWNISGTAGTAEITITKLDPVDLGTVQASIFIYEDDVYYNASTSFDHISRTIKNEPVTGLVNVGDSVTITKTFTVGSTWDPAELHCVACLQQTVPVSSDRWIWQGAVIPYLVDFSVHFPELVASVPNGNGEAFFHGTITNDTSSPDVITLSMDNGFAWPTAFQVEGDPTWYSGPTPFNFSGNEGKEVTVRVTTDNVKQIDTGNFRAQSQNTGRLSQTGLRVFNGSYSVLFVDDDGSRTDETPWITALNAYQYLFDNWNVLSHNGLAPNFEQMAGFDVVLWQTGYWTTNLLTSADTTNIKAYLDLGGSLLLNSGDYINSAPQGTFVRDYLGVSSSVPTVTANRAVGIPGDPITNGMDIALTFPTGGNRADQINPVSGANVIFNNHNALPVALRFLRPNSSKVVFNTICQNGFPTSGADPNNSNFVIQQEILWLVASGGESVDDPVAIAASGLRVMPNPVVRSTELSFALSAAGSAQPVRLTVIDPAGRQVRTLLAGRLAAGDHRMAWDGCDDAGRMLPSGIYFAKLQTADGRDTQKLVLMK